MATRRKSPKTRTSEQIDLDMAKVHLIAIQQLATEALRMNHFAGVADAADEIYLEFEKLDKILGTW